MSVATLPNDSKKPPTVNSSMKNRNTGSNSVVTCVGITVRTMAVVLSAGNTLCRSISIVRFLRTVRLKHTFGLVYCFHIGSLTATFVARLVPVVCLLHLVHALNARGRLLLAGCFDRFDQCTDTTYRDNEEEEFLLPNVKEGACFTGDSTLTPAC